MIDFRIETFLEVCRLMNYTKAADSLHITQPAVSQHVRLIEEYYDTRLFSFSGKKMSLTPAGEQLRNAMTTMQHDIVYLKGNFQNMKQQKHVLTFGVTLTIGEYIMPACLSNWQRARPDTLFRMKTANTRNLLGMLTQGEIDFALVEGYFEKNEYDYQIFSVQPYIPVCAVGHQFKKSGLSLNDLTSEHLIAREDGSGSREILEKCLEEHNLNLGDFNGVTEISNIKTLKKMTAEDFGISFLYKISVEEELDRKILMEIPVFNLHLSHGFYFIWRKGSIFTDWYQEIFNELKNSVRLPEKDSCEPKKSFI